MVAVSTGPNRVRPRTRPPCSALGCVVCYRDDNPRSRTFGITRQLRMPIADGWTGHRRDVGRRGPTVHRTYVLSSSCSHCPARGVPELLPPRVAGVHRCEDVHVGVRVLSPPAERPSREPSERRVRTPCGYGSTAPTGTLETCVPTPAKRPDPSATSPAVQAVLSVLSNRVTTFAPGAVIGAGVYLETGRLWHALALACVIGAPTKAMQKVAAEWIELLRPPRRWRRPRRRGT